MIEHEEEGRETVGSDEELNLTDMLLGDGFSWSLMYSITTTVSPL